MGSTNFAIYVEKHSSPCLIQQIAYCMSRQIRTFFYSVYSRSLLTCRSSILQCDITLPGHDTAYSHSLLTCRSSILQCDITLPGHDTAYSHSLLTCRSSILQCDITLPGHDTAYSRITLRIGCIQLYHSALFTPLGFKPYTLYAHALL